MPKENPSIVPKDTIDHTADTYYKKHESIFKMSSLEREVLGQNVEQLRIQKMKALFKQIGQDGRLTVVEQNLQGQDRTDVIVRTMTPRGLSAQGTKRLSHGTEVSLDGRGTYCFGKDAQGENHIYIKVKLANGATGYIASEHLHTDNLENVGIPKEGKVTVEKKKTTTESEGTVTIEQKKSDEFTEGEVTTEDKAMLTRPEGTVTIEQKKSDEFTEGEVTTEEKKTTNSPEGGVTIEPKKADTLQEEKKVTAEEKKTTTQSEGSVTAEPKAPNAQQESSVTTDSTDTPKEAQKGQEVIDPNPEIILVNNKIYQRRGIAPLYDYVEMYVDPKDKTLKSYSYVFSIKHDFSDEIKKGSVKALAYQEASKIAEGKTDEKGYIWIPDMYNSPDATPQSGPIAPNQVSEADNSSESSFPESLKKYENIFKDYGEYTADLNKTPVALSSILDPQYGLIKHEDIIDVAVSSYGTVIVSQKGSLPQVTFKKPK